MCIDQTLRDGPQQETLPAGSQPEYTASAVGVETVLGSAVTNNGAASMIYLWCWVPRTVSGLAPSLEASGRALIYARIPSSTSRSEPPEAAHRSPASY